MRVRILAFMAGFRVKGSGFYEQPWGKILLSMTCLGMNEGQELRAGEDQSDILPL